MSSRKRWIIGVGAVGIVFATVLIITSRPPREDIEWIKKFGGAESINHNWSLVENDGKGNLVRTRIPQRVFKFATVPSALVDEARKRAIGSASSGKIASFNLPDGTMIRVDSRLNEVSTMKLPAPSRLQRWLSSVKGIFGIKEPLDSWYVTNG